ncbi:hypothetical protein [Pseudoalteromonas citrea]|uniref:hypothetical protein n=1 Tax=Pseudoalteromonas citrea TaxID=43655 RepID=UPI0020162D1A|nr:hypothetical protein [Pseudoalteromonas citrea]
MARSRFAEFVVNGIGINLWQNITNQVFLGSDAFVQRFLSNEEMLKADLSEVPKKQVRAKALTLRQYEQTSRNRNEAIQQAYLSGHYSQKELGEFFNLHYSRISRIIAKGKACPQNPYSLNSFGLIGSKKGMKGEKHILL